MLSIFLSVSFFFHEVKSSIDKYSSFNVCFVLFGIFILVFYHSCINGKLLHFKLYIFLGHYHLNYEPKE